MQASAVRVAAAVILGALAAGCGRPIALTPLEAPAPVRATGLSQTGTASWYGPGFHGKVTANGETYDQMAMTAAHRTLPLGTRARVTNLSNGKVAEVRITDRGPFVGDRIIDLSRAAAEALSMIGPGTAEVRLDVLETPVPISAIPTRVTYTLQLGAFTQAANAEALRARVVPAFAEVRMVAVQSAEGVRYRVFLGSFDTRDAADEEARRVVRAGFAAVIVEK